MTTTYNLRPAAQRILTVRQEQLLQAGKKLEGDTQTRTFKNGRKGHTGAGLSPWRTAKKVTRPGEKYTGQAKRQAVKVQKRNGQWSYPEVGGSEAAAGLSPWKGDWEGHSTTAAKESRSLTGFRAYLREDGTVGHTAVVHHWYAKPQKNPTSEYYYAQETLDEDNCVRQDWRPAALTASNGNTSTNAKAIALRAGWERAWHEESLSVEVGNKYGTGTYWKNVSLTGQYDPRTVEPEVQREAGFEPATTGEREEALTQQLRAFGTLNRKAIPLDEATCIAKGKYERKGAAQDKALRAAFTPRNKTASDGWLTLSTTPVEGEEPAWTPTTDSHMAAVEAADEARVTREAWYRVLGALTEKQLEAVTLRAEAKPLTTSQRDNLQLAREKARRLIK